MYPDGMFSVEDEVEYLLKDRPEEDVKEATSQIWWPIH